jgi:hypothetical protein
MRKCHPTSLIFNLVLTQNLLDIAIKYLEIIYIVEKKCLCQLVILYDSSTAKVFIYDLGPIATPRSSINKILIK